MDQLQFTVIGCGDAFSSGGRLHSCFHLQTANKVVLIDCGATALLGLKQQHLSSADIDILALSHFHGDHIAGVPFLLLDMAREHRRKPLHIVCPQDGQTIIRKAVELFYSGSEDLFEQFPIRYHEFQGRQTIALEGVQIDSFPVVHKPESKPHGLRIAIAGKVVAYSGDTEWTDVLPTIAAGADLLLCECTFYEQQVPAHLNYLQLEERLDQLVCKQILLTHLDEEMLEQQEKLSLRCAYDGMKLLI